MMLQNITLEISLKPFYDSSPDAVREVCRKVFQQWLPLCRVAEQVSILIWASDGSEILDYSGDLQDTFEWAKYIGGANPRSTIPGDPDKLCLHSRYYLYRDDAPEFTYERLKFIVETLKFIGREITEKPIRVGATFDPGPEFAKSEFKYANHNEICLGNTMGRTSFVSCYGVLHGDSRQYAGFPDGIPEGTPFGKFLGRQSEHFLSDLGFDYIWLSNGFGFGTEAWGVTGAVFDGQTFRPDLCPDIRSKILEFWNLFRSECPKFPIETRGTNLSTGMDLSSDAVPLKDIYAGGFNLKPPVNSPWAAINGDFGLELVGWMSHIAELPGEGFPFRFYTHDPWWLNSPWLDRYKRQPHDIYLPLSVSRINDHGNVEVPDSVELLTVDDSYGRMPDQVPCEVIPHIQKGLSDCPDAPGPVIWVYPFDEYHQHTFDNPKRIYEVFFGDWFMRDAVNQGLPLNTVISTRAFTSAAKDCPDRFLQSVLVTTAPQPESNMSCVLEEFIRHGGRVLLYGPLEHADLRWHSLLGVQINAPLSGEFDMQVAGKIDECSKQSSNTIRHAAEFSGGGLCCTSAGSAHSEILAKAVRGGDERITALHYKRPEWNGGAIAWVRGTLSCNHEQMKNRCVIPYRPTESYRSERLMRLALSRLGVDVAFRHDMPDQAMPAICISRHRNAFLFSGYVPDQLVDITMRLPAGAPLFQNIQTRIEDGKTLYRMPLAWHHECRVFVEQDGGMLMSTDEPSVMVGVTQRYLVTGLRNATLRFFPDTKERINRVKMLKNPTYPYLQGEWIEYRQKSDSLGLYLEVTGISGDLMIYW